MRNHGASPPVGVLKLRPVSGPDVISMRPVVRSYLPCVRLMSNNAVPLDITRAPPALASVGLLASTPATTLEDGTLMPAAEGIRHEMRHTFATFQLSTGVLFMQVSKSGWAIARLRRCSMFVGDWVFEQDGGAENYLPEPLMPRSEPIPPLGWSMSLANSSVSSGELLSEVSKP